MFFDETVHERHVTFFAFKPGDTVQQRVSIHLSNEQTAHPADILYYEQCQIQ